MSACEMPSEPGLARLVAWIESGDGVILARNWVYRAVGAWRGDDAVLPLEAAEWEGFAGLHDEDGLWAGGSGSGSVVYRAQLPAEAAQASQITLLAELSAWRRGTSRRTGRPRRRM